jgi:hypothetical protein
VADLLLQCETNLGRALDRALNQLKQAQDMREAPKRNHSTIGPQTSNTNTAPQPCSMFLASGLFGFPTSEAVLA